MLRRWRLYGLGGMAIAGLLAAGPGLAHHSFAMFDHDRSVTLKGSVARYQWTNPHGYIMLDADDGHGVTKRYLIELTSINMLSRAGWNSRTIKSGDKVTAIMAPLRDGQAGGLLLEVQLPDGKTMVSPVPQAKTFRRTP
ncbi:MAG: hypothetical protein JWM38_269 [Sphingomonas bacterium]|jgi:hypothetical protein|nr:hypothetical protein [Sphingomonas bacterium]MDB5716842.1 hypothetical protein [Sphingomonas bacterium]